MGFGCDKENANITRAKVITGDMYLLNICILTFYKHFSYAVNERQFLCLA